MPHLIRDWMSSPVVVVDPDSSVSYALTLMRRRHIHSVVVDASEKNPQYGIIIHTDIRDKILVASHDRESERARDHVRSAGARPTRLDLERVLAGHAGA